MSEKTKLALGLLAASLALGLLGDMLLRATPFGLNFGLWVTLFLASLVLVARWRGIPLQGGGRWLALPAAAFAFGFAWRDSLTLGLANTLALFVCLSLVVSDSRAGRVAVAGLGRYVEAGLRALIYSQIGFFLLWLDVKWGEVPRGNRLKQALAVGRGLALVAPLAVLFGGLFASADAVFSRLVADLFNWDVEEAILHLFWIGLWSWLVGGVARGTLRSLSQEDSEVKPSRERPAVMSLGIVEMATVLGSLDLLFLAFVLVQLRYLFGGATLVEASVHLTYAQYARNGFFELVAVVALALPVLLALDWLRRREKPVHDLVFRALAGVLVAMLFVVMVSALQRMRLYQEEFGLSELRLYTTAFMGWLALLLAWFLATVLRGRRERFAFGAMVGGLAVVAALNLLNPDAFIVSTNVERAQAGKPFDAAYLGSLSADAVPEIVRALPSLSEQDRAVLAKQVLERWSRPPASDLRTWSWGRQAARQAASTIEEPPR